MKPAVFYMKFFDEDTEEELTYGFIIQPVGVAKISKVQQGKMSIDNSLFAKDADELETIYGVHDWSSAPSDEVEGIGYTTYEVERSRILELTSKWREVFMTLAGGDQVSEVVKISSADMQNDTEIYQQVNAQLSLSSKTKLH